MNSSSHLSLMQDRCRDPSFILDGHETQRVVSCWDHTPMLGKRHGNPVVYKIKSGLMSQDRIEFFLSENGVWLTKAVPVKYLEKI